MRSKVRHMVSGPRPSRQLLRPTDILLHLLLLTILLSVPAGLGGCASDQPAQKASSSTTGSTTVEACTEKRVSRNYGVACGRVTIEWRSATPPFVKNRRAAAYARLEVRPSKERALADENGHFCIIAPLKEPSELWVETDGTDSRLTKFVVPGHTSLQLGELKTKVRPQITPPAASEQRQLNLPKSKLPIH